MIGIRKCLHHAVIGNGNSRMAPLEGALYNVLCLRNPVHIAHLRVTMEFYALAGAEIHSGAGKIRYFLNTCNGTDGQFVIELINHGDSFYFHKGSRLQSALKLLCLIVSCKYKSHPDCSTA